MARALDVAAYLISKADLEEGDGMTHLKLQKLLYYCQGFSIVILGRALFDETIEAWTHGPVVRDLYPLFKKYGNGIIEKFTDGEPSTLTEEEKKLIDEVYEVYGSYSAWKLRNLTHNETPWMNAESKNDKTITYQAMLDFFPSLMK